MDGPAMLTIRRVEPIHDVHAEHDGEHGPAHRIAAGGYTGERVDSGCAHDGCSSLLIMAIQLWGALSPSMIP